MFQTSMFLLCMLLDIAIVQVFRMLIWNLNLAILFVFLLLVFFVYLDIDLVGKELMQELQKSISRWQISDNI